MNQITGEIDLQHENVPTYAESLGMIEYAKMTIYKMWSDDVDQDS